MWETRCLSVIVTATVFLFQLTYGQVEVCMFYNLQADCYYRVDSVCLSHITAEVNQCADPVEVQITITCKNPSVDFDFTFSHSDQTVSVPGFANNVELHVKLKMKEKEVLNVEADFYVNGKEKTDFINSDVKLAGMIDNCPLLNKAAQIAIGIMGGLVLVAAVLILVLLYVRYRRKQKLAQSSNDLVTNAENPGLSTPRTSTIRQEDLDDEQTMDRSPDHQQSNSGGSSVQDAHSQYSAGADLETNTYRSGSDQGGRAAGLHSPKGMRYSDMVNSNHNQLKISDC